MAHFADKLARLLVAGRWWLLALAVVLAAISARSAQRLDFDRSLENMFAPENPLLPSYERLKETFGGNEVVIAAYRDDDLFAPDHRGLLRLEEVASRMSAVEGVEEVLAIEKLMRQSPGDIAREAEQGTGDETPYIEMDGPLAERLRTLFAGYTHNAEGDVAALAVMLLPEGDTQAPRRQTIDRLRDIAAEQPHGLITGEPVMVVDGYRYVEEDGHRLTWWSTLLLGGTILLCFHSVRWVVIPLVTVWLTLLLTKGLLVASGIRLSMVSSMLTAIVTVIVVATVIHITVHFREARLAGLAPADAMQQTISRLARPILFTCLTDAIGFSALLVADVGPVRDFGLMMAAGSLMVLVSVPLTVPGLALAGSIDADPRRAWGEGRLDAGLGRIVSLALHGPRWMWFAVGLTLLVAALGVGRLKIESDFTRNFRRNSPIVRSYVFVEEHLGGAGVWDVMLPAPDSLDWKYLQRIDRLESRLRQEIVIEEGPRQGEPALTKVISLADAVQAGAPRPIEDIRFAPMRNAAVWAGLSMMRTRLPAFVAALHGEDPDAPERYWYRIMLRSYERQSSAEKQRVIDEVTAIARDELKQEDWQPFLAAWSARGSPSADSTGAEPLVTGFFVLLTNLIGSVIADQWLTFAVATAGIGLMMALAFRSVLIALVALVPNTLPILVVLGLMGWLGLPVNMGAAMIAAVSMGLSIDSSIHYIESFRRARAAGISVGDALRAVQHTTGRAMVFSTLALIVGFGALSVSNFVPTVYFGALVGLAMLGGLAGNLFILPLLLSLVTRDSTERP